MGIKIVRFLFTVFLLSILCIKPSYSAESGDIVRVGITDNNFQNVLKQQIVVFGTDDCDICDKYSHKILLHVDKDTDITVTNLLSGMEVQAGGRSAVISDFVIVCPSGLLGVRNLKRKGMQALYHGAFELVQKPDHGGFYLVNLVEIQDYLKGVVPNEMPVKFGLEALKAQAVAARNYVLTPRTQAYDEFNVVDSVASQVYFGANTESDLATRAVMETDGIVALYDNNLILTLYCSTAGGYTESYLNAFSDPKTKIFPSINKPYLVGIPDREEFAPLDTEEKVKEFYSSRVPSYDIESPYYRWEKTWAAGELENVLKLTLAAQSKTGFVSPVFNQGDELGQIKDIKVMKRGVSGKAMAVDIMTSKGSYRVSKELVIRRVFQKNGVSLPSANVIFEKSIDQYGNVTDITVYGGGYGHGVGMSQFGAGYMATKRNQPYYNILRHYYSGINLGTKPADVFTNEVTQNFWSPIGRAKIVAIGHIGSNINVIINGKNFNLNLKREFFKKEAYADISRYIEDGENRIVFLPSIVPYKVYVELVEKYETKKDEEE